MKCRCSVVSIFANFCKQKVNKKNYNSESRECTLIVASQDVAKGKSKIKKTLLEQSFNGQVTEQLFLKWLSTSGRPEMTHWRRRIQKETVSRFTFMTSILILKNLAIYFWNILTDTHTECKENEFQIIRIVNCVEKYFS